MGCHECKLLIMGVCDGGYLDNLVDSSYVCMSHARWEDKHDLILYFLHEHVSPTPLYYDSKYI